MDRKIPTIQVNPEEDLPTLTSSLLTRISTSFTGRPIYRNNSAPRDLSVGNDIPWSPFSSTSTLIDSSPIDDAALRVSSVQRQHSRTSTRPADPYAQFRWGYGRHLFGPASRNDSPVVVPATGSNLFRPPKMSTPLRDPLLKSESSSRRKNQEYEILDKEDESDDEFEILNKEDESDDEFFDAEEFFDTGDTGDTEIVDAGPKIETHHAFTADEEELLADAIRDDRDIESIRTEFQGFLARLNAEHRGKK
ncbi:hypothetical protein MMC15_006602 [Xylographa vitiligo]|nr:hypothetical protein [Xylographa vitiligo]